MVAKTTGVRERVMREGEVGESGESGVFLMGDWFRPVISNIDFHLRTF